MINYNNVYLDYVPPIDLNVANNAATNITKGHKEAIAAKSALDTFIGQLNLNESEDPYKQELKDKVRRVLDDSLIYGSDFASADALTALSGEFASDQELISKLKLNEQYQNWKNGILNNKDIDQDTKDYLISRPDNQYDWDKFANYELDENGNQVFKELTPFKAGEEAIRHYNIGDLAVAGMKLVKPNSYQNGEYSVLENDFIESTSTANEGINKNRLLAAAEAYIRSNPEYMASIDQEMRVQSFVADKYNQVGDFINRPDLYNTDHTTKSMDKYIRDKVLPLAEAAAYSKTSYQSQGKVSKGATVGSGEQEYKDPEPTSGVQAFGSKQEQKIPGQGVLRDAETVSEYAKNTVISMIGR